MSKKIGIVIHSGAALFSNGITQNAYFLYMCLQHCGHACQLLCNESNPVPFQHDALMLQQIVCNNVSIFDPNEFKLIITVTRSINSEQYDMFHSKRIRVIGLVCGNHYMQDQEEFIHGSSSVFSGKATAVDELWTIPCYKHSHTYLETIRKVPVFAVPHLWHPCILEKRTLTLSKVPAEKLHYDLSAHTGAKINIIIMEPNLALFKNAWTPLIACEYLHMKYPELINNVFIFNFPDHPYALSMAKSLSLGSKLQLFRRKEMDEIIMHFNSQQHMPIFLSHQTLNELNYLYYELLYFGYPLVHNSGMLESCGYYYEENNIELCANSILHASKHHSKGQDTYKSAGHKFLEQVDPLHSNVCRLWNEKIKSVI
jgi:hypothetical protein